MKKGHRKVSIWTNFDFDLVGLDTCYILGFYRKKVELIKESFETENGLTVTPGTVILRLGGRKTSAGFSTIWFDDENDGADGKGLVYKGKIRSLDGEYLCFTQLRDFQEVKPTFNKYKVMFFAFIESGLPEKELLFTNQVGSGRVTETTNVILRRDKHEP